MSQYKADVEAGTFPAEAETVLMDPAVLDEVLGRSADDRAAAPAGLARDPARPRPLTVAPDPTIRVKVVRTRAELRAALAARRAAGRASCRRWAGSTPGTRR